MEIYALGHSMFSTLEGNIISICQFLTYILPFSILVLFMSICYQICQIK